MELHWKLYSITVLLKNTTSKQEITVVRNVIAESSIMAYKKMIDYCQLKYRWIDKIKPISINMTDGNIIV